MSDTPKTVDVITPLPIPPEGYDPASVEFRPPEPGEARWNDQADGTGEWKTDDHCCAHFCCYFVARPLALRGTAWLLKHKDDAGMVFEYPKGRKAERWAISNPGYNGTIFISSIPRWTRWVEITEGKLSTSNVGMEHFADISDATVNILLPAIGEDDG